MLIELFTMKTILEALISPKVMSERAEGPTQPAVTPIMQSDKCIPLLGYASRVPASSINTVSFILSLSVLIPLHLYC